MGTPTLLERFKSFVSSIGFRMFLWGIGMTADEYFDEIYEQEKMSRNS